MQPDSAYLEYRPMLLRLAYRIVGSLADAEDVVQDTFVELNGIDLSSIRNPRAYLAKSVTNRSINLLKSARRTRETYIGPWLPEPAVGLSIDEDPWRAVEKQETLSYAFVVLLQQLTPDELVVFLLREALAYEYEEISDIVGKTVTACRKLLSRAKKKMPAAAPPAGDRTAEAEGFAAMFKTACETGDFRRFVGCLTGDAGLVTDGGGKVRAALREIEGRDRILAMFEGIVRRGFFEGDARLVRQGGDYGVELVRAGGVTAWIAFLELTPDRSAVRRMYFVMNPEKLPAPRHGRIAVDREA